MAEAAEQNQRFELRHYEAVRQEHLARNLGRVSINNIKDYELEALKQRRRIEIMDTLAEGLKLEKDETSRTAISTNRRFEIQKGKIVAQDGEVIEELLGRALSEDIKLAARDNFFAPFLPSRTRYELDEHRANEAMCRNEADYNTIITFSPYSEEYDDGSEVSQAKLIRAAQKPYYKRAMIRLSHWDGQRFHMLTRSIDNANVDLLKEVASRQLNYEFAANNSTDMLGERIHRSIKDESWSGLIDALVGEADSILAERMGGKWRQGVQESRYREALEYVKSQDRIVEPLIKIGEDLAVKHSSFESYNEAFNDKLYDALALLEKRLELGKENETVENYQTASTGAGAIARAEGRSYDACGLVIGSGQANPETVGKQTGYESLLRLEGRLVSCPNCDREVVVDKKYLQKGELYCNDCGYHVDVCTGRASIRERAEYLTSQVSSGFEILARSFKKISLEANIKRILKKQAMAETEFEKRQHSKQLREEQKKLLKIAA